MQTGRRSRTVSVTSFSALPSIGGRYSALSNFGTIPGAIQGIDIAKFLDRDRGNGSRLRLRRSRRPKSRRRFSARFSERLQKAAATRSPSSLRPAFRISARGSSNCSPNPRAKTATASFPSIAKQIGAPDVYGNDRVFVYLRLEPRSRRKAGQQPSTRSKKPAIPSFASASRRLYDIGQEFFRWEIATAVAGSIIGINAFNQPDVEASKIETRKLTDAIRKIRLASGGVADLRRGRHQAFYGREECSRSEAGVWKRCHARRLPARASQSPQSRRLLRGARLHPDE